MTNDEIDLRAFLNQHRVCEALTLHEVEVLLEFTELVRFRKNAIIADIGEVGEALYFVVRGEASLVLQADREQVELAHAREGDLLGEMSFFDREPRSIRLVATRNDTRLLRLTTAKYQRLRIAHPFIAVNLLEQAVVSLDRLLRSVSHDMVTFSRYIRAGRGD